MCVDGLGLRGGRGGGGRERWGGRSHRGVQLTGGRGGLVRERACGGEKDVGMGVPL